MSEHPYTIDASNKPVGRIATEAARVLIGKHSPDYTPNRISGARVLIEHAGDVKMNEAKRTGTTYTRYSGHPGGLTVETANDIIARKGYAELIRKAVYGMLPANKLRTRRMKRLTITE